MFTGIIGALGTVESITPIEGSDAAYLTLNAGDIVADLDHGGSLAVNGVCLTAIAVSYTHLDVYKRQRQNLPVSYR